VFWSLRSNGFDWRTSSNMTWQVNNHDRVLFQYFDQFRAMVSTEEHHRTWHSKWIVITRVLFQCFDQFGAMVSTEEHHRTWHGKWIIMIRVQFQCLDGFGAMVSAEEHHRILYENWIVTINVGFSCVVVLKVWFGKGRVQLGMRESECLVTGAMRILLFWAWIGSTRIWKCGVWLHEFVWSW